MRDFSKYEQIFSEISTTSEKYELISQMKRAAYSIRLNIAEGMRKKSQDTDFTHFLDVSWDRSNELDILL